MNICNTVTCLVVKIFEKWCPSSYPIVYLWLANIVHTSLIPLSVHSTLPYEVLNNYIMCQNLPSTCWICQTIAQQCWVGSVVLKCLFCFWVWLEVMNEVKSPRLERNIGRLIKALLHMPFIVNSSDWIICLILYSYNPVKTHPSIFLLWWTFENSKQKTHQFK